MPFLKSLCLASFSFIVFCSSAFGDDLYREVGLPNNLALKTLGLERAWWNQASIVPRRSKMTHLSVDEQRCYTLSSMGDVTAFDSETGKKLWTNQVGLPDQPNTPIVGNSKYALFTAGSYLYAMDHRTGDRVFKVRLPKSPSAPIVVDENHVYTTGFDGSVFALSLSKIEDLYKKNRLPQWSKNVINWRYNTSMHVPAPVVTMGNIVNFISTNGSLYSVSADNRKLNFQMEANAKYSAPLGQYQGYIYAATEDNKFYCINTEYGKIQWEFTTIDIITDRPIVVGEQLFLLLRSGGVICLSAETGIEQWWQKDGKKFLAASKSKVYLAGKNKSLIAISRETGKVLGSTYLAPYNRIYSNALTDRIFLAANTGLVVSLREIGSEFPTYHLHPENQPILPSFANEEKKESKTEAQKN